MRKPSKPERLYVDFDGFFAACEEQADPLLLGRPVGVIPFRDARGRHQGLDGGIVTLSALSCHY